MSLALFAKYAPKAINATVIGLYYLAFFFANSLVGWVGAFYQTMPTTTFWLIHVGLPVLDTTQIHVEAAVEWMFAA